MTTQTSEELRQHSWQLTEMGPVGASSPIPPDLSVTLEFGEEAKFGGKSACNGYFGSYEVDGPNLSFSAVGATRMYCGEAAMQLEDAYFTALGQVQTYQLQDDQLTLFYDQGKSILLFSPRVAQQDDSKQTIL